MAVEDLQRAIDATMETASPLTRRVFCNRAWDADSLERFINRVMGVTVATVRDDGRPHAAIVLAACLRGTIHLAVSRGSVLLGNLRRRPEVALTIHSPEHDVIVQGRAVEVGRPDRVPDLMGELHHLTRRGQFTPPGWDGYLYSVEVEKLFLC